MKTPIKLAVRSFTASLAIATALAAAQSAWAGYAWTGEGADEYYGTANNKANGPSGRGVYFVDGIEDNGGVMRYASNSTVRFNSYTLIGGAPVRIGRASQTDSDKIWTFIPDNDECGFYLDSGYDLEVGFNVAYGDGYLRMLNGKLAARRMYIGPNANDPATKGVLSIGSVGHSSTLTATDNIEIRNGALITTNTAVTCGDLTAANKNNSTVTIDKTGGDWCVGNLAMNTADGTTATFYNRGGNLVVTNNLTVQNRGSGEFYMEGGHVIVSNMVRFGEWTVPANGIANLYLNGGVFEAKTFRFHNSNGPNGYVVLNGGTYKAMTDGSMALNTGNSTTDGRLGAVARLYFKVGERGGTIDTAGYDVVFPLRLLQDGSNTGGLCVKGGGSLTLENANVTYTGKTCIEVGTTLVVSNSTVKSNILLQGLELVGAPTVGTSYTIFRCNDNLTNDDLANVTCGVASEFTKVVGEDGKSIVVTATALKSGYWTGAKDNNLSDSANWSDGVVPTSGTAEIYCPVATTFTVGDTFSPGTITISDDSAVVTLGVGDLHLSGSLTNAMKLAVAQGASLTVDGDLVLYKASGTALYSNEGTVIVKGDVDFQGSPANTTYYQYEVVTDATMPIMAGGLAYNGTARDNWKYLTVYLGKNTDSSHAGQWVIGDKGLYYKSSRNIWHTGFMIGQGVTTLSSSSDWSLSSSGKANSTRDLGNYYDAGSTVIANSSLVLDTNNYTNNAVSHTITLNGRLISSATTDPAVTIKGAGTVVVNAAEGVGREGYQKTSIGTTLAVTDTATLKINKGKSIGGEGRISLAAGTTLALDSSALGALGDTKFTPCIPGLVLPETGVATIRIDGVRLRSGDHVIATVGNEATSANVALDSDGKAIDGRRASLRVEDGKLMLNIQPSGLRVIIR